MIIELIIQTPEELEREHFDWNVATATKRKEVERLQNLNEVRLTVYQFLWFQIKKTGYTQYVDDKEYNKRLKEEIRPDDPMYDYFMSKRQEEEKEEKEEERTEESGKPVVEDYMKASTKPKYRGPLPPPNRFGIMPGYRWDGITRGINYEAKRFTRSNITKMRKQQAYQWSVANL